MCGRRKGNGQENGKKARIKKVALEEKPTGLINPTSHPQRAFENAKGT